MRYDSDGDGWSDGGEVIEESDPWDANDYPSGLFTDPYGVECP